MIEIIELNIQSLPIESQSQNLNLKISKFERFKRIIQQNEVNIKILKREIKILIKEIFDQNIDENLKELSNKKNEFESLNLNLIQNEFNLISKIDWNLFNKSSKIDEENFDEIKEILNFPKYKSNEELKSYIEYLLKLKNQEKLNLEITNEKLFEKLINEIKKIDNFENLKYLPLINESISKSKEGIQKLEKLKKIENDWLFLNEFFKNLQEKK